MSDETINTAGQTENQEGTATVEAETPKLPAIVQFLEDVKANPAGFTDVQVVEKVFDIAQIHFRECWTARLPQTAEAEFNHISLAFSIIQKMLLVRHGAKAVQVPQQPADKPLVSLA